MKTRSNRKIACKNGMQCANGSRHRTAPTAAFTRISSLCSLAFARIYASAINIAYAIMHIEIERWLADGAAAAAEAAACMEIEIEEETERHINYEN